MEKSISEDNGLAAIDDKDLHIYSIGISTAGLAEIRMAKENPSRRITATTIDQKGFLFAKEQMKQAELSEQITVKLEDVSAPLPYEDSYFDFIYARLVLHYLPKDILKKTLKELYRILKSQGRLFVVVRSTDSFDAKSGTSFDPDTAMTTFASKGKSLQRYFHDIQSIQAHLLDAGFHIKHVKSYNERLCLDFERKIPSREEDPLIEVLSLKTIFPY